MNAVAAEVKKRGRKRIYNYPSELKCSVTGKVVKTNPIQFKKALDASGLTQVQFIATYVSREGRRKLKEQADAANAQKQTDGKADAGDDDGRGSPLPSNPPSTNSNPENIETRITPERLNLLRKHFPKVA